MTLDLTTLLRLHGTTVSDQAADEIIHLRAKLRVAEERCQKLTNDLRDACHVGLGQSAVLKSLKERTWIQCGTVSNECLGGCRSMREHNRFRLKQVESRAESAEADAKSLRNQVVTGIYDAASVGITLIKTDELNRLKAEVARLKGTEGMAGSINVIIGLRNRIAELEGAGAVTITLPDGKVVTAPWTRFTESQERRIVELEAEVKTATEAALRWAWKDAHKSHTMAPYVHGLKRDEYIHRGLAALLGGR